MTRGTATIAMAALFVTGALGGLATASADIPSTTTAVSCTPVSMAVYSEATCTATVSSSANFPYTGLFIWSSSIQASFSTGSPGPYPDSCAVSSSGTCSVTFIPLAYTSQPVTITAAYEYDTSHQESTGTASINLVGATSTATSVSIVTAIATATSTLTSVVTTTTTASVSLVDAVGLVILVAVLMIVAFIVGEWRRTRHPVPHA